ncbi:MAG: Holliday junction branch migration protein RuvA, partial [Gemmatimonadales bacterium]|nr:Holliday junction branch migration protein RuvA [Gemmatimonadales bacterium]
MIASVSGRLAGRDGERVVVETDGGVGYALAVPLGVAERLPPAGGRVTLVTELVVREDDWLLFGFDSLAEREVFRRLLGASGLGPRLALAMLSALGPARAVRAIAGKDVAALATVPGIGRKRAERMILELEDKLRELEAAFPDAPAAPAAGGAAAVAALAGLG